MSLASRLSSFFAGSTSAAPPASSDPLEKSISTSSSPYGAAGSSSGNSTSSNNSGSGSATRTHHDTAGRATTAAEAAADMARRAVQHVQFGVGKQQGETEELVDYEAKRPPYLHSMIAGGLGGSTGDMMMHSLDTVKTRQQGAPTVLKYSTMGDAYATILREEGFRRGLYSGVTPAFMGSFPGTMIFFGTYEYSKRNLIDMGCPQSIAYLAGGLIGDLFASVIYVPSEVLKTRLQLQGRYNNPYFKSGYNYRNTLDAARTIIRTEGTSALFHGYKATLMRDLPFSALQFTFYEEFRKWAIMYKNSRDIGIPLEIITGGCAGGLAGVITCPLDVVKTRIQTQVNTTPAQQPTTPTLSATTTSPTTGPTSTTQQLKRPSVSTTTQSTPAKHAQAHPHPHDHRTISTSSPSTTPPPKPGQTVKLNTNSIIKGLGLIYKTEGFQGWFRGVGPRMVWTSVQSGTMLVLYQSFLRYLERWWPWEEEEGRRVAL